MKIEIDFNYFPLTFILFFDFSRCEPMDSIINFLFLFISMLPNLFSIAAQYISLKKLLEFENFSCQNLNYISSFYFRAVFVHSEIERSKVAGLQL